MVTKDVVVNLSHDVERGMAKLVSVAGDYESRIYLHCKDRKVNAKSIMGVMTMVPYNGDTITVSADGSDEAEAVDAILAFFGG